MIPTWESSTPSRPGRPCGRGNGGSRGQGGHHRYRHLRQPPCFTDAGYAPQNQLGDRNFTNNKVIAAKVFNNNTPSQGFTAEAIQEHGTHVAGTVACNFETPATVNGVTIPYKVSGVAPRALLGNYNVFPGEVGNAAPRTS